MNHCGLGITRAETSCGPPKRGLQELSLRVVTAKKMRAEGDAERMIKMLVDDNPAFRKRDSEMRRLDLENETLKSDGVIVTNGTLLFDGED